MLIKQGLTPSTVTWNFIVMPMGLRNAPETFQTLMNSIVFDCIYEFVVVDLDDLLVFSNYKSDHLHHLRTVLSRLKDNELYVGKNKYELYKTNTEYIGLQVGRNGVSVGNEWNRIIQEWPKPSNISELRSFVGLLQFFRRFIKYFSRIAAPLTNMTRKKGGLHKWDSLSDSVFQNLKRRLVESPIMRPPD